MKTEILRVAVAGATGRMGREIIKKILYRYSNVINLKIALTRKNSKKCNMDVGDLIKDKCLGIKVISDLTLSDEDFDILIDFTSPKSSIENLKFCQKNHKNVIIGTTGFSYQDKLFIKHVSKNIGIVFSSNFSIGIALIKNLIKNIIKVIGYTSDIDIIESHHKKKIDLPSGTALDIKENIKKFFQLINISNKQQNSNVGKQNDLCKFSKDIKIHSIRAGNIIGEHIVMFTNIDEQLKIIHTAYDRSIFADGALRSALWLGKSKIGLFDINDVLNLNISQF